MIGPPQPPDVLQEAGRRAVEARRRRAEAKRQLAEGEIGLAELVESAADDSSLARMPVSELIAALPGYGTKRTESLMKACGISPRRRLGGLGIRQKSRLMQALAEKPSA